jgi:phosphoribosylformylglycinamidine (FGAM) synthase PurS component
MTWRIEVRRKDNTEGDNLKGDMLDLGVRVDRCEVARVYYLVGQSRDLPSRQNAMRIAEELLSDKVWEGFTINERRQSTDDSPRTKDAEPRAEGSDCHTVEVAYNPGVTDPVTESALKGIGDMGITDVAEVKTATEYLIWGSLPQAELDLICAKLLVNPTVQHIVEEP